MLQQGFFQYLRNRGSIAIKLCSFATINHTVAMFFIKKPLL